jgi:putative peptidoglycan lipid II flippase
LVLATSIDNAEHRFYRAAFVPLAGGILNLLLLVALAGPLGVLGAAFATTAAAVGQLLLFASVLGPRRHSIRNAISAPGAREAVRLFWPLLVSGIFARITIVAERYFGSHLGEGSISEIFYASNIVGPVLLLSTGIATVFFPRMSQEATGDDFEKLGATLSLALRGVWVLTAPVMLIGVCLAKPLITAVFVGGRFTAVAGAHVGSLLQIYFLSVAGSSLGMVTGRVLYALKKTGVVAVVSTFEALAYVAYTALLVAWLGAAGVGWGFVIYVTASIPWHLAVIIRAARWMSFRSTIAAMSRTTLAATAGAGVAYFVTRHTGAGWPQLLAGGFAGVMTFTAALAMVSRPDMTLLVTAARGMVRLSR